MHLGSCPNRSLPTVLFEEAEIDNCYDECEGCIVRMETGSESEFEESEFEDAVAS